jgi:hypothetical protein
MYKYKYFCKYAPNIIYRERQNINMYNSENDYAIPSTETKQVRPDEGLVIIHNDTNSRVYVLFKAADCREEYLGRTNVCYYTYVSPSSSLTYSYSYNFPPISYKEPLEFEVICSDNKGYSFFVKPGSPVEVYVSSICK